MEYSDGYEGAEEDRAHQHHDEQDVPDDEKPILGRLCTPIRPVNIRSGSDARSERHAQSSKKEKYEG